MEAIKEQYFGLISGVSVAPPPDFFQPSSIRKREREEEAKARDRRRPEKLAPTEREKDLEAIKEQDFALRAGVFVAPPPDFFQQSSIPLG